MALPERGVGAGNGQRRAKQFNLFNGSVMKAIQTSYKGYNFRSRLEARWAVFFDAIGLKWVYEPEGYELADGSRYLPDFFLPDWKCWVEIKPTLPSEDEVNKFTQLVSAYGNKATRLKQHLMLCGTPSEPKIYLDFEGPSVKDSYVALVVSGETAGTEKPVMGMSAFAFTDGGKTLDVWPIYITDEWVPIPCEITPCNIPKTLPDQKPSHIKTESDLREYLFSFPSYAVVTLYHQFLRHRYFGNGVVYKNRILTDAYKKAKSARFEFGESPRF